MAGLIVQKFGGTSVADPEKIRAAARKAIRAQQQGNQVVTVVSAMGHNTDHLVDLAGQVCDNPPAREMDMLLSTGEQVSVALMAMAVHSLGAKAVSLTGGQMGIKTDSTYTKARIKSIDTTRIRQLLDEGNIVIAAGFQGIDEHWNITTLGRGGSDTTAVALASVLGADACEIYTDVDGVYTCDPRQLPEARRVDVISYDEMLELASLGAGVMHSRSIEFAKKFDVPIHVRSSFTDIPGTMIVAQPESDRSAVGGATLTRDEARITVLGVPDIPGTSQEIFSRISARKISVDMIVQNVGSAGKADVSFTVPSSELQPTLEAVHEASRILGAQGVTHDKGVSKVSVVGLGMSRQAGVAHRMFRALAQAKVNIQMITTSEIKISALVPREHAQSALRAVHQAFSLHERPADAKSWEKLRAHAHQATDVEQVVTRLRQDELEELTLTEISLDDQQACVTLTGVPDAPGLAADVFQVVGGEGIFVDMIVQGYDGQEGTTSISFTVRRSDLKKSIEVARSLANKYGIAGVSARESIAKLTVSGIGLRSHTSVGTIMFKTLSDAGINVQMINTSELQVNVVVDGSAGTEGLKHLRTAFGNHLR
jgi:aspartate kinase